MAKHKRERALFELLAEERERGKARPTPQAREAGGKPAAAAPPPPRKPAQEPPAAPPQRTAPTVVTRKAVITVGGFKLQAYHLVIVGVIILCLCYLCYLLGARFGGPGDGLPDVPAHPTMEEIQGKTPDRSLVGQGPTQVDLGRRVQPGPAEPRPGPAEPRPGPGGEVEPEPVRPPEVQPPTPPPEPRPTGPQYRVRIQRLDVSQPDAIDALRAFLARSGIETELETRRGYHVLYSRTRFGKKQEADALAVQVNKILATFENETGRPTSKDAYTVQINRE
jgi:hypothetical protein